MEKFIKPTLCHINIQKKKKLYASLFKLKSDYDLLKEELEEIWEEYLNTKNSKDKLKIGNEYNGLEFYEQANRILDMSFRYNAFSDATHYWEGQWILKQKDEALNSKKVQLARNLILERISYVTPLFISTFHALPGFCSEDDKPMFDFFDILIVDEAGQVTNEIGVSAFAFANKAIVVGDVHQIEPIWNISKENIDKGNLEHAQLLQMHTFSDLKDLGVLCSSGSLMHLAQKASSYEVNKNLGGTLLTEHRRCVDELLAFSNHYVYDDMLQPMVGSSEGNCFEESGQKLFLPPLSYLNVRGDSEESYGSKHNLNEASAIARWININGNLILRHYNKDKHEKDFKKLKDILAVITPFTAQKKALKSQFETYGLSREIIIGTVHSLQGAEREIIIFSPVYGASHASNQMFFDAGFNMLNVALTRAKKHFIVMGTMRLFDPANDQKPSGGLAKYLFSNVQNELSSTFLFDVKNIPSENRLDTLERHQDCLKKAFEIAIKRIVIVSPFISINAIIADNILEKIKKAVSNNVEVIIYTDKGFDLQKDDKLKKWSEEGRNTLVAAGATLKIVNGIHNKGLAIDLKVLAEGSFNWLSAVRDKTNPYYKHEITNIFTGEEAKSNIAKLLEELAAITATHLSPKPPKPNQTQSP